jgi:hypothetical protein
MHNQFHKPLKISGTVSLSTPNTEEFPSNNSQFSDRCPPDTKTLSSWIMATSDISCVKQNCHDITLLSKPSLPNIFVNPQRLLLFYENKTENPPYQQPKLSPAQPLF